MTPIISPWIIYALSLCDGAKMLLTAVSLLGLFIYGWLGFQGDLWKIRKGVVALFVSCFVIGCLIPSYNTAIQMLVAQNVTYERVEVVGQTVEDIYEDILSVVGGDTR